MMVDMALAPKPRTTQTDDAGRRYIEAGCVLCSQAGKFVPQWVTPVSNLFFCAEHVEEAEQATIVIDPNSFDFTYTPAGANKPAVVASVPGKALAQADATDAELLGRCVTWLLSLGRKVELADVEGKVNPARVAAAYVAAYEGDFAFLVGLKSRRFLTPAQVKAVMNCLRADALRRLADAEKAEKPAAKAPQAEVDVPAGHYALPSHTGNNDADFYNVQRPTEGKWAGYTFVKRVIGGHDDTPVRGAEAKRVLAAIAADPEAGARYGQLIGRCGRCNRHLTDQVSRDQGYGPECIHLV